MYPLSMEKAMLKNMFKKTGKPIEEWISIINNKKFVKNKDVVKFLKGRLFSRAFLCSFNSKQIIIWQN